MFSKSDPEFNYYKRVLLHSNLTSKHVWTQWEKVVFIDKNIFSYSIV